MISITILRLALLVFVNQIEKIYSLTTTKPNPLTRCPYMCGVNRICDPGTQLCVSCQRYCHTRISHECYKKCKDYIHPHILHNNIGQNTSENIIEHYSAARSENEPKAQSSKLIIWIMASMTVLSILSLITLVLVFIVRTKIHNPTEIPIHAHQPERKRLCSLNGTECDDIPFPYVCTHSNTSMTDFYNNCTINMSLIHLQQQWFITSYTNSTDNLDTEQNEEERMLDTGPHTIQGITNTCQNENMTAFQRSRSENCLQQQSGITHILRLTRSTTLNYMSSFWRRNINENQVYCNRVQRVDSGTFTSSVETEVKQAITIPCTNVNINSNEPNPALNIRHPQSSDLLNEPNESSTNENMVTQETISLLSQNNQVTSCMTSPQLVIQETSRDISNLSLRQHKQRNIQHISSTEDIPSKPKNFVKEQPTANFLNLTSSNNSVHSVTTKLVCQPTQGRHYDGNDGVDYDDSLGIRINLNDGMQEYFEENRNVVDGLIDQQPDAPRNAENNGNGLIDGYIGNIDNEPALQINNVNDHDNYLPRSLTDDSAMASMYDPAYVNRDGFHLAHIDNNPIYEQLQRIPWVMGYHSEGQSISIYTDLDIYDNNVLEQQLFEATGQPPEKFKLKRHTQI